MSDSERTVEKRLQVLEKAYSELRLDVDALTQVIRKMQEKVKRSG